MYSIKRTTLAATGLLLALLSPLASATASNGVQATVLTQASASWEGTPYTAYPSGAPELSVVKISIAPHTELDWHTHPMPNVAYVLAGELTVETRDQQHRKTVREGEVLPEVVARQHRGTTGAAGVELLVFYAGSNGLALSEPSAAAIE